MRKKRNPAPPADPLLLADDTPCIEGHWPDGTPWRMMKPADPAPPAPESPVTPGELKARIEATSGRWIDQAPAAYATWAQREVVWWWANAERIRQTLKNARPVPAMPGPFPASSADHNEGLHAAGLLSRWLVELEGPRASPPAPSAESPAVPALSTLGKEARALALLMDHPEWTDAEIARNVPCNRTSIYRFGKYMEARELLEKGRMEKPRGSKSKDGDVEAWDDE